MRTGIKKVCIWFMCIMMACTCVPANISFAETTVTTAEGLSAAETVIAPVAYEVTDDTVTLAAVTGYEYSKGGTTWQNEPVFENLSANTKYVFYQRLAATEDNEAGPLSDMLEVTTLKHEVAAPAMPILNSRTDTTIKLVHTTGYQYSLDGESWQNNSTLSNLEPDTMYYLYQRVAETSTCYASEKSPALVVRTKASAAESKTPELEEVTATAIVLRPEEGYEYSKNGTDWQDDVRFDGLEPGTLYTVKQRVKEDNHQVSGTVADLDVRTLNAEEVPEGYIGIYDKEDLDAIRNDLDGKYILMNNIVFTASDFGEKGDYYNDGDGWTPIGKNSSASFTGIFNGNGYSIVGLRINARTEKGGCFGLFGYSDGTIRNLGVVDHKIYVRSESDDSSVYGNYAGAVAGRNTGTVNNCYASGSIESIVDGNYMSNCTGGIVGYSKTTVLNCYNLGHVASRTTDSSHIDGGGVCGNGKTKNCYNMGNVDVVVNYSTSSVYIEKFAVGSSSVNCYSLDKVMKDSSLEAEWDGKAVFLTEKQMQDQDSFKGFDFDNTWTMSNSNGYSYPVLKNVTHIEIEDDKALYAGGNGSAYNPFVIKNKAQLDNVRQNRGAHFILEEDLSFEKAELEGEGWKPIGLDGMEPFYGVFDGNGHIIEGLYIDIVSEYEPIAGLFGVTNGIIENLGVVNGRYKIIVKDHDVGTYERDAYAGGIAAFSGGVIRNCYNTNEVIIIDDINNEIYHSYSAGICGGGYSNVITDCYNNGFIQASGNFPDAAGITAGRGKVRYCYNTGYVRQIDNSTSDAGGIGEDSSNYKCYSIPVERDHGLESDTVFLTEEQMQEQDSFDGFDFENVWVMNDDYKYPQLRAVKHRGSKENNSDFAGGNGTENDPYIIKTAEQLKKIGKHNNKFFALANDINLKGAEWDPIGESEINAFTGTLDGNGYSIKNMNISHSGEDDSALGLIGFNAGTIKNVNVENASIKFKSDLCKDIYAGVLCGFNTETARIEQCYINDSSIDVEISDGYLYLGGIAGQSEGMITESGVAADIYAVVTTQAVIYAGGVTGYNERFGSVEKTFVNSRISGTHYLGSKEYIYWGGICGENRGKISDSFFCGSMDVTGNKNSAATSYLAGISGYHNHDATIKNVYQAAVITGVNNKKYAHLIGSGSGTYENAFYTTGNNFSGTTGIALTDDEMMKMENFVGFDFESVWMMPGSDEKYKKPVLKDVSFLGGTAKRSIEMCDISGADTVKYSGEPLTPEIRVSYHGTDMTEGIDYTVEYFDNVNAGTGRAQISGKGDFVGTVDFVFNISQFDISDMEIEFVKGRTYPYTGDEIKPEILIGDLIEGKDFQLVYKNNVVLGTAAVTANGVGNYTGSVEDTFVIDVPDLKASSKVVTELYGYNDISVKWNKVAGATGYYVYYKSASSGRYILFDRTTKLSCKIPNCKSGVKYYVRVYPYVKIGGERYRDNSYKTSAGIYTLKKVSISNVKKSSRNYVKVSWKNISGESGYQIARSKYKTKKFSIVKTVSYNYSSKKIKTTRNKTYYYKVRAYKTVNGKKIYGPWSSVKSFKLK